MKNFATKLLLCALLAGTSSFDVSGMERKFEGNKENNNLNKMSRESLEEYLLTRLKIRKYLKRLSDMEELSKKTFIETVHYFTLHQKQLLGFIDLIKNLELKEFADIFQEVYTTYTEVLKNIPGEITYQDAMAKITIAIVEVTKKLMDNPFPMLEIISNISSKQFIAILDQLIKNIAETGYLFEKDGFEALASTSKKITFMFQSVKKTVEETGTCKPDDLMSLLGSLNL